MIQEKKKKAKSYCSELWIAAIMILVKSEVYVLILIHSKKPENFGIKIQPIMKFV